MAKLTWDNVAERLYETGIEEVALYVMNSKGAYEDGVAWNGVTALNITPSGAEPTNLYANNKKYLALMSAEEIGATIEAYTYPEEFAKCDGSAAVVAGVYLGQQARSTFGLVAKTRVGNDVDGNKHGYKLHILYGCLASPSEKAYATINDSPEANTFSWEVTTTAPAAVAGYEPTAYICIDSTKLDEEGKTKLVALEATLYGGEGESANATLPLPTAVATAMGWTAPAAG